MAERFLRAYGLEAMLADPRCADNEARVVHGRELDTAVTGAIGARTLTENLAIIDEHTLTAGPVSTAAASIETRIGGPGRSRRHSRPRRRGSHAQRRAAPVRDADLLPNEHRPTGTRVKDLTRRAVESPSWR